MISTRKPEDGPGKKKATKWDYNPVECGSQWRGWIAGPPFGAWVHYDRRTGSKPCLAEMTDHALQCACKTSGLVPDWRGYVPYYDEQYAPKFALITFEYLESVSEICHLAPIVLRRGKTKTDPVIIESKPWRTTPIPYTKERERPVDLARFLVFTLWKDAALEAWCKKPKIEPIPPRSTEADSLYNDPGLKKLVRLAQREEKLKAENEHAGEVAERIIQDALAPKTNGKHTKPKL